MTTLFEAHKLDPNERSPPYRRPWYTAPAALRLYFSKGLIRGAPPKNPAQKTPSARRPTHAAVDPCCCSETSVIRNGVPPCTLQRFPSVARHIGLCPASNSSSFSRQPHEMTELFWKAQSYPFLYQFNRTQISLFAGLWPNMKSDLQLPLGCKQLEKNYHSFACCVKTIDSPHLKGSDYRRLPRTVKRDWLCGAAEKQN